MSSRTSAPGNWADFWNVEKFAGKRGVYKSPKFNLEFALIADGVPAAEVNATLSAEDGIDRAFAKLDELKAPHHLVGNRSTGAAVAGRQGSGDDHRLERSLLQRNRRRWTAFRQSCGTARAWTTTTGSSPTVTRRRTSPTSSSPIASRPERMGDQTNYISYGPLRKGADAHVNPDILPAPAHRSPEHGELVQERHRVLGG